MSVKKCVSLLISLLFVFSLTSAGADEGKVGTISLQDVLAKSQVGLAAQKKLEAKLKELQDKFAQEQQDLENLAREIEKKGDVWSKDVLAEKERSYQKMMRTYKAKTEDAQYELKQMEKKVMEPILKDLHEIISEYGKAEGFTLIFENTRKGLRSRIGLLYAAPDIDISADVLKMMDARFKQ